MKIILTGVTGFIGHETLLQCLANPSIMSIIALSRRALPDSIPKNPKLKVLILEDFTNYTPEILSELTGAEACIWNLGVKNGDIETFRKVSVDYTKSAIAAFSQLASANQGRFRFVFMSGFLSSRDQTKSLWFLQEGRRLKGQAEILLLEANEANLMDAYVLRPASVLPKETSIRKVIQGLALSVGVAELSAAALNLAAKGCEKKLLENTDLVKMGKVALAENNEV